MQRVMVAMAEDIPQDTMKAVEVLGRRLVLVNVRGSLYALADRCTHAGAALSGGTLDGYVLKCPVHGAMFDVRTGEVHHPKKNTYGLPVGGPASGPVGTYEVQVDDGEVFIVV